MPGSLPQRSQNELDFELTSDINADDVSSLAQTAQFERRPASGPAIDAHSRYRVIERLGAGGFGVVFKAWDNELERTVAIKLLRPGGGGASAAKLLAEARTLARLDHPAIVPVYDLGRTTSDDLLIVSKFIEGRDLGTWLKSQRMTPERAARCVATIAEALDYAHAQGIVHRDVKPGNILLTAAGDPVLSDFGLALHEKALGSGSQFVGTPAYMSPEQARYEGHRVDGRSDIYSLGTVLYELLAGSRPFQAKDRDELLDYIRNVEARPPRQIARSVPRELERICLKALAKRASDRYLTAGDMASDLRDWLATERAVLEQQPAPPSESDRIEDVTSSREPPIVVPHGLRSFDETDADFFLYLLPGARDRDGVPESVRFWKRRIESADPDEAFRVGVLLGPSGSGKSSLLRAGVVPLLDEQIEVIIVDASPADLEERLRRRLARELPEDDESLSLHDLAVRVRQHGVASPGKTKLLIVIDQFEQWLNVHDGETQTILGETLRQCDGVRLQALLLVRDDFTLAVARFLEELEEPLLQNRNFAAMDLFSPEHAATVLEAFGRAYRAWEGEPTRENRRFIDQAVRELAQGGRIFPVQLAALAEIVKERPWTDATLRQLGGMQGVDVEFLEQRLVGERSHPEIRLHLPAVRRLLTALLPAETENIRGQAKTRSELLAALGDVITPQRLDKLLLLLDVEVRLITPVRTASADSTDSDSSQRERAYQLTHDYLVSAIRAWLTASERSTRSGRARLRLKELAETWNARPAPQRLPTFLEWLTIRTLARPAEWSPPERRMMRAARRRILSRTAVICGSLLLLAIGLGQIARHQHAEALYSRLLAADTSEVPAIVSELAPYHGWINRRLHEGEIQTPSGSADAQDGSAFRRQLHKELALAGSEPQAARFVVEHLEQVAPENLAAVITLLAPQHDFVTPLLWQRLAAGSSDQPQDASLPAASALAAFDHGDPRWHELAPQIARRLIAGRPAMLAIWLKHLSPCRAVLVPELLKLLDRDAAPLTPSERSQLFESLAVLAADDPDSLVAGLERAEAADMLALWPSVERQAGSIEVSVRKRLDRWTPVPNRVLDEVRELPAELATTVHRFSGSIDRRWAYVSAGPREEFESLAAGLKSAGYAPLTLRPFTAKGQLLIAAAFDRSPRICRWQFDVPAGQATELNESALSEGWMLRDLAYYSGLSASGQCFALLWERAEVNDDSSRVLFNANIAQFKELNNRVETRGFALQRCLSFVDESGHIAYSALWRRPAAVEIASLHTSRYACAFGDLYPGLCVTDVRLHLIDPRRRDTYSPTERWENSERLAASRKIPYALMRGDAAAALELSQHLPATATNLVRQGTAAARLSNKELLKNVIAQLEESNSAAADAAQLRVRLALLENELDELPRWLRAIKEATGSDNRERLASSLALAASINADSQSLQSQLRQWRVEALAQLQQLLEQGLAAMPEMVVFDPDFDALRETPELQDMLRHYGLSRRYDSVWQERKDLETRLLYDLGASEHERRAKELSEHSYRLSCLDVQADAMTGQVWMASAWQRDVPAVNDSIAAASGIARLAAAEARLGAEDLLADVLRDKYGREARAQAIEVVPGWLSSERLLDLLRAADSLAVQRGLLLALGGAAPRGLSAAGRQSLLAQFERLAAGTSDASLRAAAQWCAKRWRLTLASDEARSSPAHANLRNWHVNSVGQTMVVLDPPAEFLMGSPGWEADRNDRPGAEQLHWQRIGRRFSIAATETTVALFKEFLEDPQVKKAYASRPFLWTTRYAPSPDCPQTSVKWFDAVRFCQWLSERENLPESEWCYPGIWDAPEDKWQLPANLLERRGYRLPTEAEWEYACRGGSSAARYYGNDRQLLHRYAWHLNNADEQSHPVAGLMPNDYGLFDMLGNVHEWCHDAYGLYKTPLAGYLFRDRLSERPFAAAELRVRRGGAFETVARQVRSADRSSAPPDNNSYQLGFRVARTEGLHPD